jgi:hypothetical protein
MSTIIPIDEINFKLHLNKCMELIFENNLKLPEDFYLEIMNLLKRYYENHGNSFEKIHELLNRNETRIDPELFKEIKSFFKENYYELEDFDCKRKITIIIVLMVLSGFIYSIMIKK